MSGTVRIHPSWLAALGGEFDQPYMRALRAFLAQEKRNHIVYPPGNEMFAAFDRTPFEAVRVVILGQDPYHGPGQAHGLCFSVQRGVPTPPSLVNIFKELSSDLGCVPPGHGNLTSWADQGVLLLNSTLSVRAQEANSHRGQGWEFFTDRAVEALATRREGLVFLLWGASAIRKAENIDRKRHLILEAPHPSPLSAHRGFFGCRHFSRTNAYLRERGGAEIRWQLPA